MNISDLLSHSPRLNCPTEELADDSQSNRQKLGPAKPPTYKSKKPRSTKTARFTMVPDKERKRSYRMSAEQQRSRKEFQNYESQVLNLTLDINDLRQQVMHLMECRDLQITRLLLTRQHIEGGVLSLVNDILFGRRNQGRGATTKDEGCSFSRMFMAQSDAAPPTGGVFEFTLQLDRPNFNHQSCTIATTQVLSYVEEDEEGDTEDTARVRVICGGAGGCLVEAVGEFTGRFTRQILTSMFPHVLSNEMVVASLIGLSINCPARLLLYFDANRQIVRQVAQADVFAAFAALQQVRPTEFAALMGGA
ncbi:hypothetical protein PHYBOEH_004165 [Phytophthora boehmeriae]|uniref:Uncharacterized protein n=1 Tax=Phytophthora boehmeriae TaxID=109152 RepID=A0A8T1WU00_9STRA|nr:hypothetical protein PHYBOEH_004165 [Phytophthora boehmeriae]